MIQKSIKDYNGYLEKAVKVYINEKDWALSSQNRGCNKINIVYYFSGHDITRVGDKYYTNTADTVKIIPPQNTLPDNTAVRTEKKGMVIDISYYSEDSFADETIVVNAALNPEIKKLFLKIYKVWVEKKEYYKFEAQSLFFQLIHEILKTADMHSDAEENSTKIAAVLDYIHERYYQKSFSYEVLPSLCNLKHTRFNQLFKAAFGVTPVRYVTELRLKLATDMLVDRQYSIAEIADATGFESVSYFSRVFSKYMGITPSKYAEYHSSLR